MHHIALYAAEFTLDLCRHLQQLQSPYLARSCLEVNRPLAFLRQPRVPSHHHMLILHVQQASLWAWQQPKPHKSTSRQSASEPQQHIVTHNIQPFVIGPSHNPSCPGFTFTYREYGSKRVCPPSEPSTNQQDTLVLPRRECWLHRSW